MRSAAASPLARQSLGDSLQRIMELLIETSIHCPYCGETTTLCIDTSQTEQETIEDCTVCCRPISLQISCAPGELSQIVVRREDDA